MFYRAVLLSLLAVYHLVLIMTIILPAAIMTTSSTFTLEDVELSFYPRGIMRDKIIFAVRLELKRKLPVAIRSAGIHATLTHLYITSETHTEDIGTIGPPGFLIDASARHPTLDLDSVYFSIPPDSRFYFFI